MHLYFEWVISRLTITDNYFRFRRWSLTLANLSLQEKLRSALSDRLTGLKPGKMRFFEQEAAGRTFRVNSATSEQPLSLLKSPDWITLNVSIITGHDAGGFVLKKFNAATRQSVSEDEIACRLGGEELAILLPHYSMGQATNLVEHCVMRCALCIYRHKGLSLGQLGVSIGVATYPKRHKPESLVKMADNASAGQRYGRT